MPGLANLVPKLMAGHPEVAWTLASEPTMSEDLLVELRLLADPIRSARVRVSASAEVFTLVFAGHDSAEFAYRDADQAEVLADRLTLACAAMTGPTRVIVDRAGDVVVRSTMVIDPGGPQPQLDTVTSWPFRRVRVRLQMRRIDRIVLDFPAVAP